LNAAAIEEKPDRSRGFALPLAESVHELLQGCCTLDLEENLIVVVSDLDVEVFTLTSAFRLLGRTGTAVVV
jgi:hypothetical protein